MVGEPVHLAAEVLGVQTPLSAEVDWGDGTAPQFAPPAAQPLSLEHVYERPGEYTVLVVLNALRHGTIGRAEAMVLVHPRPGDGSHVSPQASATSLDVPPVDPPSEPPVRWLLLGGVILLAGAAGGAIWGMRRWGRKPPATDSPAEPEEPSDDAPRPADATFEPVLARECTLAFVGEPPKVTGPSISFRPVQGPMTMRVREP
jgi:hypothetical protein